MKRNAHIAVTAFVLAAFCALEAPLDSAAQTSKAQPGYAITITGPTEPIHMGTPINIIVTVTNTGNKDVYWRSYIGKNSAYKAFRFLLMRDGHEVATTFLHRKLAGRQRRDDPQEVAGGSSVVIAHSPGKMFDIPIDLTRLYTITDPGLYTLEVSRYDRATKSFVHSNVLELQVIQ